MLTEVSHAHAGKSPKLSCQASCTEFLPSEPTLIREFLELYFDQWAKTCSIQSELHSYILICMYIDQAFMQSRSIRTMLFRSSSTLRFGFLICTKIHEWRTSGGTFSRKCGLPFVSVEHTLGFLGLQTVCLNKVSPFSARHIGDSCGIRWQRTFVHTNMHIRWPSGLSCNRSRLVPNSESRYLLTLLL